MKIFLFETRREGPGAAFDLFYLKFSTPLNKLGFIEIHFWWRESHWLATPNIKAISDIACAIFQLPLEWVTDYRYFVIFLGTNAV